ncbi:MAG: EAL domain-containing protein [Sphingobium sp.]
MSAPRLPYRARRFVLRVQSRLSVKMTLVFAGVFIVATALSLYGTRNAIERYAESSINHEMSVNSEVFNRITSMHFNQLAQAGQVLAADFGFREAVATGDAPTIESALDSLKARLNLDDAFVVDPYGDIVGLDGSIMEQQRDTLFEALDLGNEQGIANWANENHMVAAAPIKAPMLIGWVVFARDFGPAELKDLAKLSAMDLNPKIVARGDLPEGVALTKSTGKAATERLVDNERILFSASPVPSLNAKEPQALLLEYSLTTAMNQYMPILWAILGFGVVGVVLAISGSWMVARRLVRPVTALSEAAKKVSAGEHAEVAVETRDEIGKLAKSFNKMVNDIEDRERKIAHMAFHDGLTGLANRALLREHISQRLTMLERGKHFSLFCLDLDNFKSVNDTLGHPTGDALLCEISARLQKILPDCFIARLGGDEFAVVSGDEQSASMTARAIMSAVEPPIIVNGHRVIVGTSIGIAVAPNDGKDPVELAKNADLALYKAKNDGKGGFRFFEATMDAEAQARRALETDLHDALRNGELELHFQPLFGLSQNRVTAFEALLRWNHPERGRVMPTDFIPVAEETGLIIPIGEWVLREACRVATHWPDDIRVAVNISPIQFRSTALNSIVLQALTSSGLEPGRLELEITESLFIDDVEATLASLHSLRELGVRVALDDFGTGYSSLSYLRSFPFDKIKIDRSFIVDLLEQDGATAIIKSITMLASALGMETTAEGVENIDQLDILREQGCNQIQGYYFSRPIPEAAVLELLGIGKEPAARVA